MDTFRQQTTQLYRLKELKIKIDQLKIIIVLQQTILFSY